MRQLTWKSLVLVGVLVLSLVPSAQAGVLPVAVSVTPDGANYRYTYGVVLTSDSMLNAGDYFTVYDFAGLVDGSITAPPGFTISASSDRSRSPTPDHISPVDNPSIPNLTWTYTGAADPIAGAANLGDFSALSSFGTSGDGSFTAQTHRTVGGRVDSNITDTQVPVPVPPAVPEPTAFVLVVAGLSIVGLRRLHR